MQTLKLSHACDDKDEKSFWNFLKGSRDSLPIDISAQDWFNYFSNLYSLDTDHITEDGETQNDISDEELDAPISNSEVYLAIKRLKND